MDEKSGEISTQGRNSGWENHLCPQGHSQLLEFRAGIAHAVKERPDADGDVQQRGLHVPLLQVMQDFGEAGHGLQRQQIVGIVLVVHAVDHGGQQLRAVPPDLPGENTRKTGKNGIRSPGRELGRISPEKRGIEGIQGGKFHRESRNSSWNSGRKMRI